jgi:hypothetical protein
MRMKREDSILMYVNDQRTKLSKKKQKNENRKKLGKYFENIILKLNKSKNLFRSVLVYFCLI